MSPLLVLIPFNSDPLEGLGVVHIGRKHAGITYVLPTICIVKKLKISLV